VYNFFYLLVAFHTSHTDFYLHHVSHINSLPLSRNDFIQYPHYVLISSFHQLQRHTKTAKESTVASSKKTSKQGKDEEIKFSENKNSATTSKSHSSGDKSKSAAKKTVKTIDAKKPVSTDVASKRTSTDSNVGQRKSVQLSTG